MVIITPYIIWLIFEIIFLVLFVNTLKTKGINEGRNTLLSFASVVSFLAVVSIANALLLLAIPVPPPPEFWSEIYYDNLFLRSWQLGIGLISGVTLFILSISYLWVKSGEE